MAVYYGLGTKKAILNDLETQLKTIQGIKYVDWQRSDHTGLSPEKYPGVFINEVRIDRIQLLGDIFKNIFSVALVGSVWARADEKLGSKLSDFIEVVEQKVMADPTRNNNAYKTEIDVIATDGGHHHPQGVFVMSLKITFFSSN